MVLVELHVPDAAPDEDVFFDLVGFGVDRSDVIGRPEGDKYGAVIGRKLETHGLHTIRMHALHLELDLSLFGLRRCIKHRERAADFSADPHFGALLGKFGVARAAVDQRVGKQLVGFGVDPMRHVRGFGGGDGNLAVRRYGHAFGFNAHVDLGHNLAGLRVDYRGDRVVFVGDIEVDVIGMQHELFGVFPRGQIAQDLARVRVHHLD
mmetsp:Transcript_15449/g.19921  ORF Transcript_15449/g.19921 Transcript_15449/m.19921 type:complete len:207 (+) Transcript_15449:1190-1810(+)